MVMMTGELEYNDLYYPQKEYITVLHPVSGQAAAASGFTSYNASIEEKELQQFFPVTAHLVLTAFILVVSIVIMNLLFGMAVSDVQVKTLWGNLLCPIYLT
jgi:hypothetical protein